MEKENPHDTDRWPTIPEVMERTGLSERTIFRRINDGTLRKIERRVPGRKPLVCLHPDDVAELEAVTLTPISPVPALPATVAKPVSQDLAALLATSLTRPAVRLTEKFFLSVDEAVMLSGLSRAYLLKAIKTGSLPALKDRGWKVHRDALERYVVTMLDNA